MPLTQPFDAEYAYLIHEGDDDFLMVMTRDEQCFRFKIDLPTIARLNCEGAARMLTRVQRGSAYIKTEDGSLMLRGPK